MPDRPYRRNCRQFLEDGSYANSGKARYIAHPFYSKDPDKYIRAFLIIQKDLQNLFEYIDPDDQNKNSYSFRTHELLMRACIEIEANLKAILTENNYQHSNKLTMRDYAKVEASHLLSKYEVKIPYWRGPDQVRRPFRAWATQSSLPWYQAYNAAKHDRHTAFKEATFDQVIEALCGLAVLLSAQFYNYSFTPGPGFLSIENGEDGFEVCIGDFFGIKFPDWPESEKYTFTYEDWSAITASEPDPFLFYPYPPQSR